MKENIFSCKFYYATTTTTRQCDEDTCILCVLIEYVYIKRRTKPQQKKLIYIFSSCSPTLEYIYFWFLLDCTQSNSSATISSYYTYIQKKIERSSNNSIHLFFSRKKIRCITCI